MPEVFECSPESLLSFCSIPSHLLRVGHTSSYMQRLHGCRLRNLLYLRVSEVKLEFEQLRAATLYRRSSDPAEEPCWRPTLVLMAWLLFQNPSLPCYWKNYLIQPQRFVVRFWSNLFLSRRIRQLFPQLA